MAFPREEQLRRHAERMRKYRAEHPEKCRSAINRWRKNNPEKARAISAEAKARKIEAMRQDQKKNPAKWKTYYRTYRKKNAERLRALARLRHEKNRDKELEQNREWHRRNPERHRERMRKWRAEHPQRVSIRKIIRRVLLRNEIPKHHPSSVYFGCSLDFLLKHLESQFEQGMTWENYGRAWHVDHIRPVAHFDLKNHPENVFAANHYSNLQPLWAQKNLKKGARYVG